MSKHTPGPWKVFICDDGKQWTGWPLSIVATNVTNANGDPRTVVRTGGQYPYEWDHGTSRDEAVANAHLIAAAPDYDEAATLFFQYEAAVDREDDYAALTLYAEMKKKLVAAKAKAEGR